MLTAAVPRSNMKRPCHQNRRMARQKNSIRAKSKDCQNDDTKDISTDRDDHDASKINGNKLQRESCFLESVYIQFLTSNIDLM
jgi:hypothetical protein